MQKKTNKVKAIVSENTLDDKVVALHKFLSSFNEKDFLEKIKKLANTHIIINLDRMDHECQKHMLEMDNKDIVAIINQKQNNLTDSLIERKSQFLEAIKKHDEAITKANEVLSDIKERVKEFEIQIKMKGEILKLYKERGFPHAAIVALYRHIVLFEEALDICYKAMKEGKMPQ